MTTAYRLVFVLSILVAALAGGFLASFFAPAPVQAAGFETMAFGPQVKLTTAPIPGLAKDLTSSSYVKMGDLAYFTVENNASLVEVTYQGRLQVLNPVNIIGVLFELRVDDQAPIPNSGVGLVRTSEAGIYVTNTFSGYWQNLPAGQHTVSMWARISNSAVTSGTAVVNPGVWECNDLIIKEYLPFGSTYLPSVTN